MGAANLLGAGDVGHVDAALDYVREGSPNSLQLMARLPSTTIVCSGDGGSPPRRTTGPVNGENGAGW